MAEATDTFGIIRQNLIDAGCDTQLTERCMSFVRNGNAGGMLYLLTEYRSVLLSQLRSEQKQIDCLDFLIYRLQKEKI